MNLIKTNLVDYCTTDWQDSRPATTPRKKRSGNYIEFRATGGQNYQHRQEDILNTILEYLNSMNMAYKEIKKNTVKI